jgi:uncharacterized protein
VILHFLDTSALIKNYIAEVGSAWLQHLVAPTTGNIIAISAVTRVEVAATLARRRRDGSITPADVVSIYGHFLTQVEHSYLVLEVHTDVLNRAALLADRYVLRSLDAIQLACAIYTQHMLGEPLTFVCADTNLLTVATQEGLTTDNPLLHL